MTHAASQPAKAKLNRLQTVTSRKSALHLCFRKTNILTSSGKGNPKHILCQLGYAFKTRKCLDMQFWLQRLILRIAYFLSKKGNKKQKSRIQAGLQTDIYETRKLLCLPIEPAGKKKFARLPVMLFKSKIKTSCFSLSFLFPLC